MPQRFDRALKSIRLALEEMEVDIVGELQLLETPHAAAGASDAVLKIILVSSPMIEFEALALGRAAAIFFPLHMLIAGEREQTRISVVDPVLFFGGSLPAGAGDPMERLFGRVELAMESLTHPASRDSDNELETPC